MDYEINGHCSQKPVSSRLALFLPPRDRRNLRQQFGDRQIKNVFLAVSALISSAGAAFALESNISMTSSLKPAEVRAKIGYFCGVANFVPVIEKCDLGGDKKLRTITLKGGGTVVEAEEGNDATGYGYKIVSSPLPVENYHAKITIVADPAGSKVIWTGKYDAKGVSDVEATKLIDGIYEGGLKSLLGR